MREIPKKNYFYLLLLSIITVALTLIFFNIYHNYAKKDESFISKNITNINSKSLKNVLRENSVLFVYIDDIKNNKDNDVQEKFYKQIKEKELVPYFVFFDNSNENNQKYIEDNYNISIKDKKMILVFEDNRLIIKYSLNKDFEKNIDKIIANIEVSDD